MKKLLALLLSVLLSLAGCEKHIVDTEKYGQVANYITFPDYFPASLEAYEVHGYSYRLYSYMDLSYEIFLDISVEKTEMDRLIADAKEKRSEFFEVEANYENGYDELVFQDVFTVCGEEAETVGEGMIEKIVYHPDTGNMVFVQIYAVDAGVYPVEQLEYFNRFQIDAKAYAEQVA